MSWSVAISRPLPCIIAANASEAADILDGLLHHECSLEIREHYTDTAGAIDHVFGLCHLLGFRFAPRIRDLADRRLYVADDRVKFLVIVMTPAAMQLEMTRKEWSYARQRGVNVYPVKGCREEELDYRESAKLDEEGAFC